MIVRQHDSWLLLITQPDHAALAARVMQHWVADGLPTHPLRSSIFHAIAQHDNGWQEVDASPLVDGAGLWTIYRKVILPLCRPALAALATLEFTFIYNNFFCALYLMSTGSKRPVTSALNNLQGAFFTDQNVLAACAFMVALPTIIVYLILSKQFVRGLTLGSTKG